MATLRAAEALERGLRRLVLMATVGVAEGVAMAAVGEALGATVGVGISNTVGVAVGVRVVCCFSSVLVIS